MFRYRETYHIENIELRETERDKTDKLYTKTEKQTNWVLIEAYKEEDIVLEKRRQKYFGISSRSWQSSQLTEINELRNYGKT